MKLLFDQNLSHRLPVRLGDLFPDSAHVRLAGMDQADDEVIWEYARTHGYCIVSQDADFAERSRLLGAPPKVIWLRGGNQTPQQVEATLRHNFELVRELIGTDALHCLEIH
jgi:predicted nuclease of predicted toxin-antitoxin system